MGETRNVCLESLPTRCQCFQQGRTCVVLAQECSLCLSIDQSCLDRDHRRPTACRCVQAPGLASEFAGGSTCVASCRSVRVTKRDRRSHMRAGNDLSNTFSDN